MIQTTQWQPDTCKCILRYSWDDSVPEKDRIHTPTEIVFKCPIHKSESSIESHFNKLMEENPRKNKVLNHLAQFSELIDTQTLDSVTFKDNAVRWDYTPDGVLEISIEGIMKSKKTVIQSWADNTFGNKKVVIK